MFKRKIKIMAAMLSLVILVACIGDTFSKYTAKNSTTMDLDILMPYKSALHEATLLSPAELYDGITYTIETTDGEGNPTTQEVTCRVLIDTNKVSIAKSTNGNYLRVTARDIIYEATKAGEVIKYPQVGYCFDPFLTLDFQADFVRHDIEGYKYTYGGTDYYGLPTEIFRYAVIPYFVPTPANQTGIEDSSYEYTYTKTDGSKVVYTKDPCPSTAYDYLRVYTLTTRNKELGQSFGSARFQNGASSTGQWKFLLIDMEKTNLKGSTGDGNGTPNWEGKVYQLRLDMGEVGAVENWYDKWDCPAGAVMYIGEIRFFASEYGAQRAVKNLAYGSTYSADPTTFSYAEDILAFQNKTTGAWTTMTYADWVTEQEGLAAGS